MAKKIIMRHPNGVSLIETDDAFDLMQKFVQWIITTNHFLNYTETEDEKIFIFPNASYVSICNIKWRKLCSNQ